MAEPAEEPMAEGQGDDLWVSAMLRWLGALELPPEPLSPEAEAPPPALELPRDADPCWYFS